MSRFCVLINMILLAYLLYNVSAEPVKTAASQVDEANLLIECDAASKAEINGEPLILVPGSKVKCDDKGCAAVTVKLESMHTVVDVKQCRSIMEANQNIQFIKGTIVDFKKCNTAYETEVKSELSGETMKAQVDLKCNEGTKITKA